MAESDMREAKTNDAEFRLEGLIAPWKEIR